MDDDSPWQDWIVSDGILDGETNSFKHESPPAPSGGSNSLQRLPQFQSSGGGGSPNKRSLALNADVISDILAATRAMPSWKACEIEGTSWYSRRKYTEICHLYWHRNPVTQSKLCRCMTQFAIAKSTTACCTFPRGSLAFLALDSLGPQINAVNTMIHNILNEIHCRTGTSRPTPVLALDTYRGYCGTCRDNSLKSTGPFSVTPCELCHVMVQIQIVFVSAHVFLAD